MHGGHLTFIITFTPHPISSHLIPSHHTTHHHITPHHSTPHHTTITFTCARHVLHEHTHAHTEPRTQKRTHLNAFAIKSVMTKLGTVVAIVVPREHLRFNT
jgi:hypothetical protein